MTSLLAVFLLAVLLLWCIFWWKMASVEVKAWKLARKTDPQDAEERTVAIAVCSVAIMAGIWAAFEVTVLWLPTLFL